MSQSLYLRYLVLAIAPGESLVGNPPQSLRWLWNQLTQSWCLYLLRTVEQGQFPFGQAILILNVPPAKEATSA